MQRNEFIQEKFDELIRNIEAAHVAAGQRVTGKTISSLNVQNVSMQGGQLWGWKYIGVLDAGRRPGKMPPVEPLRQWVIARGIDAKWQMTAKSAAYIIARKIRAEGTALYRQGGRKDILEDNVQKFLSEITKQIAEFEMIDLKNKIHERTK